MIPKKIHYCWFGRGEKNNEIKACIESWKKYLPDYEIKEWNEENFNINKNLYCLEAYKNKKWAFVSDYVRLYALYNEGGIYLDTDVEITGNLDPFLNNKVFFSYHSINSIPSALIGSIKKSILIEYLLSYYLEKKFELDNDKLDEKTNIEIITKMIVKKYNLNLNNEFIYNNDFTIYPKEYFTEKISNENNYAIHHCQASWLSKEKAMEQVYSFKTNYNLTLKWLKFLLLDNEIKLNLKQYKNISIYGYGEVGRLLEIFMITKEIDIKYLIDKNININQKSISIIDEKIKEIDLIIVTPIYAYGEISKELRKNYQGKIISIEELFI